MKFFTVLLSLLILPIVFPYSLVRYLFLKRNVFKQYCLIRNYNRKANDYNNKYVNFQMELLKDENS